jgi:diguanylate cyclase (GGDEF)-like protein
MAIFVSLRYRMDESQEQLRYIQNRDPLTKLLNQEAFRIAARDILMQADPTKIYAIEYLDINNFGYINENYGYKAGDNILRLFAEDISEQETFCTGCRLYSDFFLILAADDNKESLFEHIKTKRRQFSNRQNHQYPNSGMGVTAGVYMIEDPRMDLDIAIENAMLAWKNSKNTGRREIVMYNESFRNRRAEEQRVIGEFFEALYRDDFQMYLQPKFLLGGERTVYGAEALARWRRPDGEILTPYYFIDALEKIGYITELDFYIYEQVLKTLDKWTRQGRRPIIISTNFSGRHFDGDGEEFLSRVEHILAKYQVDPGCVEIEVTESVMVQSVDVLRHCMDRLHEMGFRVAIDDFGTGYSSLSVLGDIPADVIKIDKSFLDNHMSDQKLSLLYEIGRMVRIMKKDIIVEGVETEEQEKILLEGGFTCAQGYLCNKPIPLAQFEELYL